MATVDADKRTVLNHWTALKALASTRKYHLLASTFSRLTTRPRWGKGRRWLSDNAGSKKRKEDRIDTMGDLEEAST